MQDIDLGEVPERSMASEMLSHFLAITAIAGVLMLFRKLARYGRKCPNNAFLHGKTAIITGANSGIGKATAMELARRRARVIVTSRSLEAARETVEEIVLETGNGNVVAKHLDLASFDSIREFSKSVLSEESHIDILVNNAGVFNCPQSWTTDGMETHIGVNHLGHFLLTSMLLNRLIASGPSRIVVVSSYLYRMAKLDLRDLNWQRRTYKGFQAYCDSKFANILFMRELGRRLKEKRSQVISVAVNPGTVATRAGRHVVPHWLMRWTYPFLVALGLLKDAWEGCQSIIYACVEPTLASGSYISGCRVNLINFSAAVKEREMSWALWDISEQLVGLRG